MSLTKRLLILGGILVIMNIFGFACTSRLSSLYGFGSGTANSTSTGSGTSGSPGSPGSLGSPGAPSGGLPPSGSSITPTGQVWYVRLDGGTAAQCNGKADAAYPGSGSNLPCAFSNPHYLWGNDVAGETAAWKIAGGDTVIFRSGPYRIGYKGPNSGDSWGQCAGNPTGCGMPAIPAGTASVHTKLLGENYANCTSQTQLHGGYGLKTIINLTGAQHVDVACLELTDYASCSRLGVGSACHTSFPMDDFAEVGVRMDVGTADVSLIDLNIHGLTVDGMNGPLGGQVNVNHVRLASNGSSGWDFDDGNNTSALPGSLVKASYLTVQWNGCNEEYPIAHQYPAGLCYDQGSGGWAYGDGIGTSDTTLSFQCDHCQFDHNTQDGFDLLHTSGSNIVITNSMSFANEGQQFKLGAMDSVIFQNNIAIGNCNRMSQAISGATPGFNANLSAPPGGTDITDSKGFCRADGTALVFNFKPGGTYQFQNNTFAGYGDIAWDFECSSGDCTGAAVTFQNNVSIGYPYPGGAGKQLVSMIYDGGVSDALFTKRDHNIYYNFRNAACPSNFGSETCVDPLLASEPQIAFGAVWTDESLFDNMNFHLSSSSPALGTGTLVPGLTTDFFGVPYTNPPNMGAY